MRQKSRIALRDSRLTAISLLLTAFVLGSIGQAQADSYADGAKLFQAKKYASAAKCFDASIKQNPGNDNAYYYHALALHYAKDMKGAVAEYGRIVSHFPSSQAADHSRRALMVLDPALLRRLSPELFTTAPPTAARSAGSNIISGSRYGSSSPDDHFPSEAKLNFTKEVGCMMVEAQFNNRPIKVMFDTGSQGTTLGKNHLQSMGLPEPTGQRNSLGYWDMRLNIKIGGIERNNFPCAIKESMLDSPSIGQSFFKDFVYTIDNNAQTIRLVKKSAGSSSGVASTSSSGSSRASADANAVPFNRDETYELLIVSVSVDGRPGRMFVDTGATSICMSAAQARNFGLTVPEDAVDTVINGTTGRMTGKKFSIRTLKLGPVEKRNVDVVVVDNYTIPLPLLGQSFLGDTNYTVDEQAKVIRFTRR
jgi:clan AA aspartic protease (TIGR02281 family)